MENYKEFNQAEDIKKLKEVVREVATFWKMRKVLSENRLKDQINRQTDDLHELKEKISFQAVRIMERDTIMANQEHEIGSLKSKIKDKDLQLNELAKEIENHVETNKDLRKRFNELDSVNAKLRLDIRERDEQLEIAGDELNAWEEKSKSLESAIRGKQETIANRKNEIVEIEGKIFEQAMEIDTLKKILDEYEKKEPEADSIDGRDLIVFENVDFINEVAKLVNEGHEFITKLWDLPRKGERA